MRRVVVTGMGMLSPMGRGVETTWQGLIHGKSAISAVTKYDVSESPAKIAGQIFYGTEPGQFDPDTVMAPKDQRRVDPFILYGISAGTDAIEDSGWKPETEEDHFRTGVMVGDVLTAMDYPFPCPETVRKFPRHYIEEMPLTLAFCYMIHGFPEK